MKSFRLTKFQSLHKNKHFVNEKSNEFEGENEKELVEGNYKKGNHRERRK